jgi:nucleotide-binding universal stress UspA family protein
MPNYERILVAIKCSAAGRHAFKTALALARDLGAHLHVFHALDYHLMRPETPKTKIEELAAETYQRFLRNLGAFVADYPEYTFDAREAEPGVEAARLAAEIGADMIVVGCHETATGGSISRIGHVGSHILQTAPCPVLLVPCPEDETDEEYESVFPVPKRERECT